MRMNLPNSITMFRVALIPLFLIALLSGWISMPEARIVSVIIFALASVTDFLDGYLARKMNLVTNFGKFMDPLADKLLVCAALIAMVQLGDIPAWLAILILSRELLITGFRTIAASDGIVLAASSAAKLKTASQMLMIIIVLLNFDSVVFRMLGTALIWISALLTVISAAEYLIKNKNVFAQK